MLVAPKDVYRNRFVSRTEAPCCAYQINVNRDRDIGIHTDIAVFIPRALPFRVCIRATPTCVPGPRVRHLSFGCPKQSSLRRPTPKRLLKFLPAALKDPTNYVFYHDFWVPLVLGLSNQTVRSSCLCGLLGQRGRPVYFGSVQHVGQQYIGGRTIYTYLYLYVDVYIYISVYPYIYIKISLARYKNIYTKTFMFTSISTFISISICIYISRYIYIYL